MQGISNLSKCIWMFYISWVIWQSDRGKNELWDLDPILGGREVTIHPDNTHLRLNLNLHSTAQHAVQCKMAVWHQCPR
jgi:hypothetical protein